MIVKKDEMTTKLMTSKYLQMDISEVKNNITKQQENLHNIQKNLEMLSKNKLTYIKQETNNPELIKKYQKLLKKVNFTKYQENIDYLLNLMNIYPWIKIFGS